MIKRIIRNVESTSIGKTTGHNDDDIYIGENFAAVIDGVSNKSSVEVNGKKIKVANIIIEALQKIDRETAPEYAKTLTFKEFVAYINMYIRKYCENIGVSLEEHSMEATGAIYSKYHNQIWVVGDCVACYDGKIISNDLKIDYVYANLRLDIIRELLQSGYTAEELLQHDISKEIIKRPQSISEYITDKELADRIRNRIEATMYETLLECGFSKEDIERQGLLKKYYNPTKLQQHLKNNINVGGYGYSIFNGINTPLENCRVEDLPPDVRNIRLSSDGIPAKVLNNSKDLGQAIRKIRSLAADDPLSINENISVRPALRQSRRDNILAIDDASAVIINIEYEKERDDGR